MQKRRGAQQGIAGKGYGFEGLPEVLGERGNAKRVGRPLRGDDFGVSQVACTTGEETEAAAEEPGRERVGAEHPERRRWR